MGQFCVFYNFETMCIGLSVCVHVCVEFIHSVDGRDRAVFHAPAGSTNQERYVTAVRTFCHYPSCILYDAAIFDHTSIFGKHKGGIGDGQMPAVRSRNDLSTLGRRGVRKECNGLVFAHVTDCYCGNHFSGWLVFQNPYEHYCRWALHKLHEASGCYWLSPNRLSTSCLSVKKPKNGTLA